jgi:hypothetical protein
MGRRAIQLALIIALGAGIGFLMNHDWREQLAVPARPVLEPKPTSGDSALPAAKDAASERTVSPVASTFKLPAVATAPPVSRRKDEIAKPPPPAVFVPADWLLRGSAPQNYDLKADRVLAFSGRASAVLVSHDKDISPGLYGSLMQTVQAAPYAGQRVEFSAWLKARGTRPNSVALWIRVANAESILLDLQNTLSRAPKIGADWTRYSSVIDVPWAAGEIGYGVFLAGKGSVWMDDAKIEAVDKAIAVTAEPSTLHRGVAVQLATQNGALANPTNMGFEDVVPAEPTLRDVPPDSIAGMRM